MDEKNDPRLYMRVACSLRQQIKNGDLKPGCPIPSIRTLHEETGYARHTYTRAITILVGEGLVERIPGLGYYVV
jgi:DNA-binding GntR family transcriptional regulator